MHRNVVCFTMLSLSMKIPQRTIGLRFSFCAFWFEICYLDVGQTTALSNSTPSRPLQIIFSFVKGKILFQILNISGEHSHTFFVIDCGTICCLFVCVCFTCNASFNKRYIFHAMFNETRSLGHALFCCKARKKRLRRELSTSWVFQPLP